MQLLRQVKAEEKFHFDYAERSNNQELIKGTRKIV